MPLDISVSGKYSIFTTMIQDEQKLSCSEVIAANPPADIFVWTRYDLLQSEVSENFTLTPLPSGTTEQINCLAKQTFGAGSLASRNQTSTAFRDDHKYDTIDERQLRRNREMSQREIAQGDMSWREMTQREMAQGETIQGEMTHGEMSQREIRQREMTHEEMSQRDKAQGEMSHREIRQREMTHGEMTHGEMSQRDNESEDDEHVLTETYLRPA
ncbi:hypothetical protein EB796_001435 [Bugula neritina]|uniref:Uncharacterized protein n=1 Tax=Bugula neritina TaxID=10212 RepID=A0A7J7KPV7_BUGNE|nr:hypothetical protein EB796_001435 [Bugula neritina]